MKVVQLRKYKDKDWESLTPFLELKAPLVLVFGNRLELEEPKIYKAMQKVKGYRDHALKGDRKCTVIF